MIDDFFSPGQITLDKYKNIKNDNLKNDNIVILTEAPTQNIIKWMCTLYETNKTNVLKQIQSGFHNDDVWESVIFQLLYTIIVMYCKKIMFVNFNLKDNVFIKSTQQNSQNIGTWNYVINGITYYVPNYGHMVLIDSNYDNKNDQLNILYNDYFDHDIFIQTITDIFDQQNWRIANNNLIHQVMFSNKIIKLLEFIKKSIINTNVEIKKFTIFKKFTKENIQQEKDIRQLFFEIPIKLIQNNQCKYVHNKIGTYLSDKEKSNMFDGIENIQIGDLVATSVQYTNDNHTYGIVYKINVDNTFNVLCQINEVDGSIQAKNNMSNLKPLLQKIDQDYKTGTTQNIIDTYYVD